MLMPKCTHMSAGNTAKNVARNQITNQAVSPANMRTLAIMDHSVYLEFSR